MGQLFIPDSPGEITPEWCTTIFRESTLLASGAVVGVKTEVIGQDRGFTGVIARTRLQYAGHEEAAPASVIIKLPTANRGVSSAYRAAQANDTVAARRYFERCAREVLFYQQAAPLNTLPVPWLYYGAVDETAGRVVLVLEDLRSTRPGDALHGCSPRETTLVIEQLAHFHARWWNHPQLETFSWLPLWGGEAHIAQERYIQCLGPFLQRFGSQLPQRIRETIETLASSYGREQALVNASLAEDSFAAFFDHDAGSLLAR